MKLRTLYVLCFLCTLVSSENDWTSQLEAEGANNTRDKRALGLLLSGLAQVFGYTVDPVQLASLPNVEEARTQNDPCSNSTTKPALRETIRLTGVLNFGNESILDHLQEYERIFHGNGSNQTSPPTAAPMIDVRVPMQPNQPLLVPNISLPTVPQPPLPEIPPQDIKLSYPRPLVIIHPEQNVTNARNKSVSKAQSAKNMSSDSGPSSDNGSSDKSRWREYEERLAELERRQQEQAERLRQQELVRNREKYNNYNGEENERNRGQLGRTDEDCRGKDDESYENSEEEGSRESSEAPNESEEEEEQPKDDYKYSVYSEPLPISKDDEHRRPEELRNSYGELLNNREIVGDGFEDFFKKLKQQTSFQKEKDETSKEDEESNEKEPATNKYEEYPLEEDSEKNEDEDSEEEAIEHSKNQSLKEQHNEELDFSKSVPLMVPVRYLTAPEELKRMTLSEKSDNTVPEATKKVSRKELRTGKKEILKPTIGYPELPKKLHDGEQKVLQMWPPPFDFILDSVVQRDSDRGSGKPRAELEPPVDRDYPENIYYQSFGKDFASGTDASKQLTLHGPGNRGNGSEVPDFWQRYRYTANDEYMEPDLKIKSSQEPSYSKNLESKRNAGHTDIYSERYRNQKMRNVEQKTVPLANTKEYDYFKYGPNDYIFGYARREKLPQVFASDQLYRYEESLTKIAGEPEKRSGKVAARDYENYGNTMVALGQEEISSTGPINYFTYPRIL
nr:PREDICTED: uncharacterized protein LOC105662819 [Megachile rotundata]